MHWITVALFVRQAPRAILVPSIGRAQACYTGASRLDCLHVFHLWQLYMR